MGLPIQPMPTGYSAILRTNSGNSLNQYSILFSHFSFFSLFSFQSFTAAVFSSETQKYALSVLCSKHSKNQSKILLYYITFINFSKLNLTWGRRRESGKAQEKTKFVKNGGTYKVNFWPDLLNNG